MLTVKQLTLQMLPNVQDVLIHLLYQPIAKHAGLQDQTVKQLKLKTDFVQNAKELLFSNQTKQLASQLLLTAQTKIEKMDFVMLAQKKIINYQLIEKPVSKSQLDAQKLIKTQEFVLLVYHAIKKPLLEPPLNVFPFAQSLN